MNLKKSMSQQFEIESILLAWNDDGDVETLDFGSVQDVEAEFYRTLSEGDDGYTHFAVATVVKLARAGEPVREYPDRVPQEQGKGTPIDAPRETPFDGSRAEERPDCSGWC